MKHCAVTFFAAAVALISAPLLATAQHTTAEPRLLDTVVVSGHVTGPGFWQVYKESPLKNRFSARWCGLQRS